MRPLAVTGAADVPPWLINRHSSRPVASLSAVRPRSADPANTTLPASVGDVAARDPTDAVHCVPQPLVRTERMLPSSVPTIAWLPATAGDAVPADAGSVPVQPDPSAATVVAPSRV